MTEFGNQDSGLDDLPELDDLSFGDSDDGGMQFGLDDDGPGLEPLDLEGIDLGTNEAGDDGFELGQPGDELSGDFDLDLPDDSDASADASAHSHSFEDAFDEGGFDETPSMTDDLGFDDFSDSSDDHSLDLDLSADDDVPEIAAIGMPPADEMDGDEEAVTGTSFFDETEDETVALSEDELQDILGNTDEAFFEDFGGDGDAADSFVDVPDDAGRDDALDNEDGRMELSGVRSSHELVPEPDLEPISPLDADNALAPDEELGFDDFGSSDDDFGDSDADVTPFSDEELELALNSPEDSEDSGDSDDFGSDSAVPGFLDDGDDDEPIALSEDELDSIMGDVEPAEPEPGHHLSDDLSEMSGDDFDDLGGDDFSGAADDFGGEDLDLATAGEEDENITLSDDELSQVLLDADSEETPDDTFGDDMLDEELPSAPSLSSLDMDDDEPIALTAEELGNIVSEVEGDEVVEASGFEPDADDFDFMAPDEMFVEEDSDLDMDASGGDDFAPGGDDFAPDLAGFENTEEEGPVALSDSELGSILEDTDSEALTVSGQIPPEDYDMAPAGDEFADGNVIVLDEYEDDASRDDGLPVVEGPPEIEEPAEVASAAVAGAGLASRAEAIAEGTNLDREELRKMIHYLDGLFDALPEDTVRQFSQSSYFDLYKKIMSELGL